MRVCSICKTFQNVQLAALPCISSVWQTQQVRFIKGKHYAPKFRKLRGQKVLRFKLPDYVKIKQEASSDPREMRKRLKEDGIPPPRTFTERNIIISSTSDVFEAYIPPEGDGIASVVSSTRAKQKLTELEQKGKSWNQIRKIKQFDEDFNVNEFAEEAQEIYLKAHSLLEDIETNDEELHDLVTEKAFPDMTFRLKKKTFRWRFVESLEPPKVVHVRTTQLMNKDNIFAQVTVRFHTKQVLAIYDRFGRLLFGSENLIKDTLEYVVFEKYLSEEYSKWRIHAKIIPEWMPASPPIFRTLKKPELGEMPPEEEEEDDNKKLKPVEDDEPKAKLATS